jgi:hypothetical protein
MEHFERYLYSLRRYARALTGSVCSGEAAVRATLERLAHEPPVSGGNRADRAALFQLFTEVFATLYGEPSRAQSAEGPGVSKPRQAFLLTALEGFNLAQAARILGTGEGRMSELVQQGRRACEDPSVPVLIIHDEPIVSMDLEMMLQDLGHRVVGIARTRDDAAHDTQWHQNRARCHRRRNIGIAGCSGDHDNLSARPADRDALRAGIRFRCALSSRAARGHYEPSTFLPSHAGGRTPAR